MTSETKSFLLDVANELLNEASIRLDEAGSELTNNRMEASTRCSTIAGVLKSLAAVARKLAQ